MGLRCLLGHDFDEPALEREREEDGNEVVTTVREVKTCARCGETQIVSENTEVTTIEQLADQASAADPDEPEPASVDSAASAEATDTAEAVDSAVSTTASTGSAHGSGDEEVGRPEDATGDETAVSDASIGSGSDDGAEIIDAGTDDAGDAGDAGAADDGANADDTDGVADDGSVTIDEDVDVAEGRPDDDTASSVIDDGTASDDGSGPATARSPGASTDASVEETAEPDDGVILDDDDSSDEPDRDHGAWPSVEADDARDDEPTPWPEHHAEDEGYDAEVGTGGDSGVEFGGGLTPESSDAVPEGDAAPEDDAEFIEAPDAGASEGRIDAGTERDGSATMDTGIARGESPELQTSTEEETTEYYCPACEMTRSADGNSMRAGDICPECKRGYVDERPI
ncbi:DUF7093 family protein [Halorubrum sp. DTA98]|uniref:DUF7093 family protein n=1 Tax=Halorubrum sp. DTA98 TaxID=3402163 RepID=UPI003AAABAB3